MTVTLKSYKMKSGSVQLGLDSPYYPTLPEQAKVLGGGWSTSDRRWYFDLRDEERIRNLCVQIYGIDPMNSQPPELVTLRCTVAYSQNNDHWRWGRELYWRPSRDAHVKLGEGVIVTDGVFPLSGGSMRYPAVFSNSGQAAVTLEVRDVPKAAFEADPEGAEIVRVSTEPEAETRVDLLFKQITQLEPQELADLHYRVRELSWKDSIIPEFVENDS